MGLTTAPDDDRDCSNSSLDGSTVDVFSSSDTTGKKGSTTSTGVVGSGSGGSSNTRTATPSATTATTATLAPCPIRSRFLNRLGISNQQQRQMSKSNQSRTRSNSACSGSTTALPASKRFIRGDSFQEVLKADYGRTDERLLLQQRDNISSSKTTLSCSPRDDVPRSSATTTSSPPSSPCSRGVSYCAAVTVHPIPSRADYSNRIRSVLWTSPTDMQRNAARNTLEFASENWDWRQAAEETDMVTTYGGERIHPVHFCLMPTSSSSSSSGSGEEEEAEQQQPQQQQQQCNLQRHFVTVMSAQQQQQQQQQH